MVPTAPQESPRNAAATPAASPVAGRSKPEKASGPREQQTEKPASGVDAQRTEHSSGTFVPREAESHGYGHAPLADADGVARRLPSPDAPSDVTPPRQRPTASDAHPTSAMGHSRVADATVMPSAERAAAPDSISHAGPPLMVDPERFASPDPKDAVVQHLIPPGDRATERLIDRRPEPSSQPVPADTTRETSSRVEQPQGMAVSAAPAATSLKEVPSSSAQPTALSNRQLHELQLLAARLVQQASIQVGDTSQIRFDWTHDELGPLRFSVSTEDSRVRIDVSTPRPEVAAFLEESRSVLERIVLDQGLRIDRFDVRVHDSAGQTAGFERRDQQLLHQQGSQDRANGSNQLDSQEILDATPPAPARRPWADHREWLA
ncbi:flagellar hook-length control protein FliK [candidate division KSB1 bacterium]|nr:flagellar hook-length control protein FliK [candidate division KSB1 bacterium]